MKNKFMDLIPIIITEMFILYFAVVVTYILILCVDVKPYVCSVKFVEYPIVEPITNVEENENTDIEETQPTQIPQPTYTDAEILALQKIAIAEAQTEGIGGMAFVMQTVINRTQDKNFPDTIEEVISQKGQFTTYSNGSYSKAQPTENSMKAIELLDVLENKGQTFFEAKNDKPTWHSTHLTYVFTYNNHVFYM